jgi:transcriptional antiterminator NusG
MNKKWYAIHAYSGFEKSVKRALEERIKQQKLENQFGDILVPVEEVIEIKGGQKNISERKFFPGYILIEMELTDETWHLVKGTPKITGFVGGATTQPVPISKREIDAILNQVKEGVEKPKPKILFQAGELVRLKMGLLLIFKVVLKRLITIKINYMYQFQFLEGRHQLN